MREFRIERTQWIERPIAEVFGFFGKVAELTDGNFGLEIHDLLAIQGKRDGVGEGRGSLLSHRELELDQVLVAQRPTVAALRVTTCPTDDVVLGRSVDTQAKGAEEGVLHFFHVTEVVGEVEETRGVGFGEGNSPVHAERGSHQE